MYLLPYLIGPLHCLCNLELARVIALILVLGDSIESRSRCCLNDVLFFHSDGDGRSGCVSSIMSVIERVKSEQTVDVFQTIKLIRAKRPGAVDTLVSCSAFLFLKVPPSQKHDDVYRFYLSCYVLLKQRN